MHPAIIWAAIGLAAGVIAKLIMPGKDKGGLLTTAALGVGGAYLGVWLGPRLGLATDAGEFTWLALATAVGGALVVLVVFRVLRALV